jgi:hypothetical protein
MPNGAGRGKAISAPSINAEKCANAHPEKGLSGGRGQVFSSGVPDRTAKAVGHFNSFSNSFRSQLTLLIPQSFFRRQIGEGRLAEGRRRGQTRPNGV